jgi:hypothetical protein
MGTSDQRSAFKAFEGLAPMMNPRILVALTWVKPRTVPRRTVRA